MAPASSETAVPVVVLQQFLVAMTAGDMDGAIALGEAILRAEPTNATVRKAMPMLCLRRDQLALMRVRDAAEGEDEGEDESEGEGEGEGDESSNDDESSGGESSSEGDETGDADENAHPKGTATLSTEQAPAAKRPPIARGAAKAPSAVQPAAVLAAIRERSAEALRALTSPIALPSWAVGVAGSTLAALALFASASFEPPTEIEKKAELFAEVLRTVESGYVQPVDTTVLFEQGINGMLHSLDPFTEFENSAARADLDLFAKASYGGVGLGIAPDPYRVGAVLVRDAREGYAFDDGLRVGDHILAVDGRAVAGEPLDAAMSRLRGEPGTEVRVTFERDLATGTQERTATLHRKVVHVPAVQLAALSPTANAKGSCGYVKLAAFSASAPAELRRSIELLTVGAAKNGKELEALVVDLRGNSGGLLSAALHVCEELLPHGSPLVITQGRSSSSRVVYVSGGSPALPSGVRLAVLIDGGTASASEIVAGALQDLDRAVIVGARSYGKGLVQSVLPLAYDTELKVTVAKYYTPSGRCVQRLGYAGTDGALAPTALLAARSIEAAPLAPPAGADASSVSGGTDLAPAPAAAPAKPSGPLPGDGGVLLSDGGRLLPDSSRKQFRTLHGRIVRDGGGIDADVQLRSRRPGTLERQLAEADVFFAYARDLAMRAAPDTTAADTGGAPGAADAGFKVERRVLRDFDAFSQRRLAQLGVELHSPLDARLDALELALKEDDAMTPSELERELPALRALRKQAGSRISRALWKEEQSAISRRIARAVDARTTESTSLLVRALRTDPQLEAAIAVVSDLKSYHAGFHFELVSGSPAPSSGLAASSGAKLARGSTQGVSRGAQQSSELPEFARTFEPVSLADLDSEPPAVAALVFPKEALLSPATARVVADAPSDLLAFEPMRTRDVPVDSVLQC